MPKYVIERDVPGVGNSTAEQMQAIGVVCRTPPSEAMKTVVAIACRQEPGLSLPVVIELEEDFRRRVAALNGVRPAKKAWWKFW